MFEPWQRISELKLEPILSKGELVLDNWWRPPEPQRVSFVKRHWLFIVTVVAPLAVASVYFGLIASNKYMSEAQFIVRTAAGTDPSSMSALMSGQSMSRASDQTNAVSEYMMSRDAVAALLANSHLRDVLSRPNANVFNRFPNFYSRSNDEELFGHFQRFIDVKVDDDSGIGTLDVWAFSAQDAQDIAKALLQNSEALVNLMDARAFTDALRLTDQIVNTEKGKYLLIEDQLTQFRNAQKVIDPNKESSAALSGISDLMASLMKQEAGLAELMEMTPTSPQIGPMRETITSLRNEIQKERDEMAGTDTSLANKFSEFDRLMLDRDLESKSLEVAVAQLNSARMNAERQQYYLQTVVQPNLSDYPLYPKVTLDMLVILVICLCVFWVSRTVLRNILEHRA